MSGAPAVRRTAGVDGEVIAALTAGDPYGEWRRVPAIAPEARGAYLRARVAAAADAASAIILLAEDPDGRPAGLCLVNRVDHDSELFEREVGSLSHLVARADHPDPAAVHRALLDHLDREARGAGYRLLSVRTDTEDLAAYQALSDAGFRLIETLVTLSYDTARRGTGTVDPAAFGFDGQVRPVEPRDVPAVCDLAARRFRHNRFHRDGDLPPERVEALMARWIESYCHDPLDHGVWVAEGTGGRVAGFLGHGLNRELEDLSGVLVSGRALVAVEDPRTRVGQMLSRAHTWQSPGDFKEADTQLDNYGMIKVAFSLDMDLVRTRYTFHRAL